MAIRKARPPATQSALERYLPYLVNRLASLGQARQNRQLAAGGINVLTLRALSLLHIRDGRTVNEIAERAFAEQSTASRAVDAMVQAGLVERHVSDVDLRRREIVLTEAGRKTLRTAWPLMDDHFDKLTRGISPEDLETCRAVLIRMLDNLGQSDG